MSHHTDLVPELHACAGWTDIVKHLDAFASPTIGFDDDGDVASSGWVFRGVSDSAYRLEPAIERLAGHRGARWAAYELLVSTEFKSRAHMHLGAAALPKDELSWLAMMQHYAIPTRLLDFTYSPFVALYFAIRNTEGRDGSIRVWAINAEEINNRFRRVAWQAHVEEEDKTRSAAGLAPKSRVLNLFDPDSYYTTRDSVEHETQGFETTISAALAARGARRRVQDEHGCVCAAAPPAFNPRLASQQGVFLLNCAEHLTFVESVTKMMATEKGWCRAYDISASAIPEIEERLFQLNIHEQSLFPDMEGLAGLIRQKIRLHWR